MYSIHADSISQLASHIGHSIQDDQLTSKPSHNPHRIFHILAIAQTTSNVQHLISSRTLLHIEGTIFQQHTSNPSHIGHSIVRTSNKGHLIEPIPHQTQIPHRTFNSPIIPHRTSRIEIIPQLTSNIPHRKHPISHPPGSNWWNRTITRTVGRIHMSGVSSICISTRAPSVEH